MANQRVVVLTDEELRAVLNPRLARMSRNLPDHLALLKGEAKLRAALGHPEGITEWRAFVGDGGESNDYADVRATQEEAEVDLANLVIQSGSEPYDRLGIEYRQCGPWVLFTGEDEQSDPLPPEVSS